MSVRHSVLVMDGKLDFVCVVLTGSVMGAVFEMVLVTGVNHSIEFASVI